MAYVQTEYSVNNGRQNVKELQATDLNIGSNQTTLVSGLNVIDFDSITLNFATALPTGSANYQVWGSIASGARTTDPLTTAIAQGVSWFRIGDPETVVSGTSTGKSFEVTDVKWIAITGSADTAETGANVLIFAKSKS